MITKDEHTTHPSLPHMSSVILALHHIGFAGTVVSGGFLRDVICGVPPKDIDVFIPATRLDNEALAALLALALGRKVTLQFDGEYLSTDMGRVFEVEQGPFDRLPVQIIEVAAGKDPAERCAENDFGLCQVWVGHDGVVRHTEAFVKDVRAKTCTLTHCEDLNQWQRSLRRWARLSQKLVGFTLVDNTGFAAVLAQQNADLDELLGDLL